MDDVLTRVEPQLGEWMGKQRWVAKSPEALASVQVLDSAILNESGLTWMLLRLGDGAVYQVFLGVVKADLAASLRENTPEAVLSEVEGAEGLSAVIDALSDEEQVLEVIRSLDWPEVRAERARILGAEQSNTSVVLDESIVVKFFRRLYPGENPDVEVTTVLSGAAFEHIAPVVGTWRRGVWDLAIAQHFLAGGDEGWTSFLEHGRRALATLHEWCSVPRIAAGNTVPSADGGGAGQTWPDLGAVARNDEVTAPIGATVPGGGEARALGEMTAALHLAMAKAFGSTPLDVVRLRRSLEASMESLAKPPALQRLIDGLDGLVDTGEAIRVHGDFHLGQTMRVAEGWRTFDFEGEPALPLEERTIPASPYKDVAGMVRSFGYAAATVLREHPAEEWSSVPLYAAQSASPREGGAAMDEVDNVGGEDLCTLEEGAQRWEALICEAFLAGYHAVPGVDLLLPSEASARGLLLDASIAEKAIYELAYEKTYRPDWIAIPEAALQRLFG